MSNKIPHYAGDTLDLSVPLTDSAGVALTGVSRVWIAVKASSSAVVYIWGPVEGTVVGTSAVFAITAATSADLVVGNYYFSVRVLMTSGKIHTMVKDAYELIWPVIKNADMT